MQRLVLLLLTTGLAACLLSCDQESIPVFPGAIGFGTDTPAGRGGKIIHVTNLHAEGKGSLKDAVNVSGPKIIVFDVSGVVELINELEISEPFVTIAGQTAPDPGIMLKGAGLRIKTHDVLIQHIRIRVGDEPEGPPPETRDAIKITGESSYNVVIDHVSISWAIDENLSTWSGASKITISNSVISEGLSHSLHPDGEHSKGFLVGSGTRELSLVGNFFAHNKSRNPLVYGGSSIVLLKNLFYNNSTSSFVSISDGWEVGPSQVVIIGNHFRAGPDSNLLSAIKIESDSDNRTRIYLQNNSFDGQLLVNRIDDGLIAYEPPVWHSSFIGHTAPVSLSLLLNSVGARVGGLDAVDTRVVNDFLKGTGKMINSPADVGGWPSLNPVHKIFVVPLAPNDDDDDDGYTNIEEELFRLSSSLITSQNSTGL